MMRNNRNEFVIWLYKKEKERRKIDAGTTFI